MTNVSFDFNMFTADAIDNVGHACEILRSDALKGGKRIASHEVIGGTGFGIIQKVVVDGTTWIVIADNNAVTATVDSQVKLHIPRKGNFAWQLADALSQ